jgi:hypothetical protein
VEPLKAALPWLLQAVFPEPVPARQIGPVELANAPVEASGHG